MKTPSRLQADAIAWYRGGNMTQDEVCAAFESETGRRLAPRTLRSWLAKTPPILLEPQEHSEVGVWLLARLDALRADLVNFLGQSVMADEGSPAEPAVHSEDASECVEVENEAYDFIEQLRVRLGI